MRKLLISGMGLLLFAGCSGGGCGQGGVAEAPKATQEKFDVENYELTEGDVRHFLDNRERIEEIFHYAFIDMNRAESATEVLEASDQRVLNELGKLGYKPPEKFFAVLGSIMEAYLALETAEAFGGDLENVDDPVLKHNIQVVRKFKKELDEAYGSNQ